MEMMPSTPHVLLATSMAAALTVVFVATLKILARSFHRATAVILALGVTILAVVGTAQIIFAGPQADESIPSSVVSGNALMLWPFLAWAIAALLAQLLAAGATAPPEEPEQTGQGTSDPAADAQPDAESLENATKEAKPRGRPRKTSPDLFSQERTDDSKKKTSLPKPSQPASPEPAATYNAAGAAEPTKQS